MKFVLIVSLLLSSAFGSTLYKMNSRSIHITVDKMPTSIEVKRYALLREDSTYQTGDYPVNAFGSMTRSIYSDSGRWTVTGDSIRFNSLKCKTMEGPCGIQNATSTFPFANGAISAPGFEISSAPSDSSIIRRLNSGFKEVENSNKSNNAATLVGIGLIFVALSMVVLK